MKDQEEQEARDSEGACIECGSKRCCEHDSCGACWDCTGMSIYDFIDISGGWR